MINPDEFGNVVACEDDANTFEASLLAELERNRLTELADRNYTSDPITIAYVIDGCDGDDCLIAFQEDLDYLELDEDYRVEVIGKFEQFAPRGTVEAIEMIKSFTNGY